MAANSIPGLPPPVTGHPPLRGGGEAENFSSSRPFAKFIGFNRLFPKHLACTCSSNQRVLYHIRKVLISSPLPGETTHQLSEKLKPILALVKCSHQGNTSQFGQT